MFSKGLFCISLDFELHWGGVEKRSLPAYNTYFSNTREVIPKILELFTQFNVHTTWATVGMLFHDSAASLLQNMPKNKPSYVNDSLSTYNYIDNNPQIKKFFYNVGYTSWNQNQRDMAIQMQNDIIKSIFFS